MAIYRLYTGDDGQSHLEERTLESHPELNTPTPTTGIVFTRWPPRQYIITLSGHIEIGLGDGATHRYGPGDARLVEDTTGQGHTTRVVSDEPAIIAIVPLAD